MDNSMADSMTVRMLLLNEIRAVYRERIVDDFPENEIKPLKMIERACTRGEYHCYGGFTGESLAAYAFFVTIRENGQAVWLFDYLAVDRERRDQGVGSVFLQALCGAVLREADIVLLEIDDPAAAEGEELAHRLRREAFYARNGLIDTGITAQVFGADFRLLEIPVHGTHAKETCRAGYDAIYRRLLPPLLFRHNIHISQM